MATDGKLYPDYGHPDGMGASPWFRISGSNVYPDYGHPDGMGASPWYRISS